MANPAHPEPAGTLPRASTPHKLSDLHARLAEALADRYTIEREVGRGAMATVLLARDIKHGRQVAIKVLSPELSHSLGAERFLREIQTTAQLLHPRILALHDSGESNGLLYYIMPYVEGESLRDRLQRQKRLPITEAIRIAKQVADALAYAHARGIVHRDIKPDNILLTTHEHACVADYGLARALHNAASGSLTGTGLSIGTPLYMSPEQAAGEAVVDGRSDIYSLACVLVEMLTGAPPFRGDSVQSVLAKHLTAPPPRIRAVRPDAPESLERALVRAMAKAPGERYQRAEDFARALDPKARLSRYRHLFTTFGQRRSKRRVYFSTAVAIPIVLLTAFILWRSNAIAQQNSIMVLPFLNIGANPAEEHYSDDMTEDLIERLKRVRKLQVAPLSSAMTYKGDGRTVSDIGTETGAAWVLEGWVRRPNDSIIVWAQLTNASTRFVALSQTFQEDAMGVFKIQGAVADAIVDALHVQSPATVVERGTTNAAAREAYGRGRTAWHKRTPASFQEALKWFDQAIQLDPGYARAYAGKADVYNLLGAFDFGLQEPDMAYSRAQMAADQALLLDDNLAQAHAARGLYLLNYAWDPEAAVRELNRAIRLDASYVPAYSWLALSLAILGRTNAAVDAATKARDLEPKAVPAVAALARVYYFARDYPKSIATYQEALELDPRSPMAHLGLGVSYVVSGSVALAIEQYKHLIALPGPENPAALGLLAHAYGRAGQRDQARALIKRLQAMASAHYVPAEYLAIAYLGVDDVDSALDQLDAARANHSGSIVFLGVDPLLDSLKTNPRFQELLRQGPRAM